MLPNHSRRLLADQVADDLLQRIVSGELPSGTKLPNEYDLAEQLGVGRGTVREAVKILASRNVLEIRRSSGTYVAEHPGRVEDPLGFAFQQDKDKLAVDLCELRLILEPQIASLAAERADAAELAAIGAACDACEQRIRAHLDHTAADIQFHEAIARAAHNQVIANVVPIIQQGVSIFISVTHYDLVEMTVQTHRRVYDAIARGDANAAYAAMREHLVNNMDHIHPPQEPQ